MGTRRQRKGSADWPEDLTERTRLAAKYGIASAENAMALLDEAKLLADPEAGAEADLIVGHSIHARAFALTVLAAEEVAKAYACDLVLTFGDEEAQSAWDAFWEIVGGRHQDKLTAAFALEQILPLLSGKRRSEIPEPFRDLLNEDVFRLRNRALYVDVRDGTIQTPQDMAKDPQTEVLREALSKSMVTWAVILQGSLRSRLGKLEGTA